MKEKCNMERIFEKIKRNGLYFNGKFPQARMQYDGKYVLDNGGGWTDGFYVGVLHLAYIPASKERRIGRF